MVDARPTPVSPRRAVGALIALSISTFTYVTTELLPVGLLTVIARDLDRRPAEIGLLVSGYAAVIIVASLPLTRLTRRVPRRALLSATLAVLVLGSLVTAAAPSYGVLLGARLAVALSQALFWSVVVPTAAGLFPPGRRGRMVARLAIGTSLAPVLGIPAGTWLGQQAGWRVAFVALSAISLATCVAVTLLLPPLRPQEGGAARGSEPSRRGYLFLVVTTIVTVTGQLTAQTYITPFLIDVTGFRPAALGPLLFVSGVAGVAGTFTVGRFLDRRSRVVHPTLVTTLCAALLVLWIGGGWPPVAVVALAVSGAAFSGYVTALQHRTLQVAPGDTDLASAGVSSAFNVGIAAGSLLGAGLLSTVGVRIVPLVGAAVVAVAVMVVGVEHRRVRRSPLGPRPSDRPASPPPSWSDLAGDVAGGPATGARRPS